MNAEYKTLADMGDIRGKTVLLRLDLNVPIQDGVITEDFRIRKSLPTLSFLRARGAKVVIISHVEGVERSSDTLKPVYDHMTGALGLKDVVFCSDCIESGMECLAKLPEGGIILCENIRLYDGEKKNDPDFAKKLASLADLYVNDAFSVSHRKHASIVGVPKFLPGFAGLQLEEEVKNLSKVFDPARPFLFILGGAKFDTKLPLVEKFLPIADTVFVGGALSNDLYKAKGYEVGASKISEGDIDFKKYLEAKNLIMPVDIVVRSENGAVTKKPEEILQGESVQDAGEGTVALLREKITEAKCVLWNGPLGNFENGFKGPTLELAKAIAASGAYSVVGGGDTLAAIKELDLEDKFGFVSTAGGAMLDFLGKGTLPGIEALKNS